MPPKTTEERLDGQKRAIVSLRERMTAVEQENRDLKDAIARIEKAMGGAAGVYYIPESMPETPVSSLLTAEVPVSGNLPTSLPVNPGVTSPWRPTSLCMACGNDKGAGRDKYLTCRTCGSTRQAQISGTWIGEPVKYTMCGHCGKSLKPSLNTTCGKCAVSFREWRDAS